MRPYRYMALVDKSVHACLAAIEVYNKPVFLYREESFSILMLNAWELLLKARVVKQNRGKFRSIEIWEAKRKLDGTKSKRNQRRRNRSGNVLTIGLERTMALVRQYPTDNIDDRCAENLRLLTEIRDSSVHLYNMGAGLSQRVQQVGSAALRNYASAAERWFGIDLSRFNFFLMPLAFHSPAAVVESLLSDAHPAAARRLLEHIAATERDYPSDENQAFNVTMKVQLRFVRTAEQDALPVRVTRDPTAPKVQISEESIREMYPWEFNMLVAQLRDRYSDFLQNSKFNTIKKEIEKAGQYCRVRYLDPEKPGKSMKKMYYSAGILHEFDKHYTRP